MWLKCWIKNVATGEKKSLWNEHAWAQIKSGTKSTESKKSRQIRQRHELVWNRTHLILCSTPPFWKMLLFSYLLGSSLFLCVTSQTRQIRGKQIMETLVCPTIMCHTATPLNAQKRNCVHLDRGNKTLYQCHSCFNPWVHHNNKNKNKKCEDIFFISLNPTFRQLRKRKKRNIAVLVNT